MSERPRCIGDGKKTKYVLASFGKTPGDDFPIFCASVHYGPTLIFQVSSNSVQI